MKKVLIVEDDLLLLMITEKVVSSLGYKVCGTAESGDEALEKALNLQPDIIVSDYRLKGELSGLDIIRKLRELNPDISFIILSGVTESELIRDIRNTGYIELVKKPFRPGDLSAALKRTPDRYKNHENSC